MINDTVVKYYVRDNDPNTIPNDYTTTNPFITDADTDYDLEKKRIKKSVHEQILRASGEIRV